MRRWNEAGEFILPVSFQTTDGFSQNIFRRNRAEAAAVGAFFEVVADEKISAFGRDFLDSFDNLNAFFERMPRQNDVTDVERGVRIDQNHIAVFQPRQHGIALDEKNLSQAAKICELFPPIIFG